MDGQELKRTRELLDQLRSGDTRVREKAFGVLLAWMRMKSEVLSHRFPRNIEPDSVVGRAMEKDVELAIDRAESDDHLFASLYVIMKHKYMNLRRQKPTSEPVDGANTGSSGVASRLERDESRDGQGAKVARLRELLHGACGQARDRALVDGYVVRGLDWPSVAESQGMTPAAAKVAFGRIRGDLLLAAIGPLRSELGEDWPTAEALLVRREPIAKLIIELKTDAVGVRLSLDRIMAVVHREYSGQGVDLLRRLYGGARPTGEGRKD